jgi:O-glycosyl hydrolase
MQLIARHTRKRARALARVVGLTLILASMIAGAPSGSRAQTVGIDASTAGRAQTIDGFGTCLMGKEAQSDWWRELYFDDLGASIVRVDMTPTFKSPYSDQLYDSPWQGNTNTLPGPDGNNVRTYTSASDYTRTWGGLSAKIAVMGPKIDENMKYFDYDASMPKTAGLLAQVGQKKKAELGDFKVIASLWSPAPWLKVSSGNRISGQTDQTMPQDGAAWPFIWNGNFAGGKLDTSGTPRAQFDDSALGGSGPTSALTQFARGVAAYARGFQKTYGVKLYALSLQNELNFEEFYSSCTYPSSAGYIAALKAARRELDQYDDLRAIRIIGPEDLMGSDADSMWQHGGNAEPTQKNLQYLQNIAADSDAADAVDFFAIHSYATDGASSAGTSASSWDWWLHGWSSPPSGGLPANIPGVAAYGKKSWMTETSGEDEAWLPDGSPTRGAFSVALKIHQALTAGQESAWLYWQLTNGGAAGNYALTDAKQRAGATKYIAAKHFFRYIRPGAVRVNASVSGASGLLASAYVHDAGATLTVVLINEAASDVTASLQPTGAPAGIKSFDAYTSSNTQSFAHSTLAASGSATQVSVPAYGIVTLYGQGEKPAAKAPGVGSAGQETPSGTPTKDRHAAQTPSTPAMLGDRHELVPDAGVSDPGVMHAGMLADDGMRIGEGERPAGTDRATVSGCAVMFGKHPIAAAYLGPATLGLSLLRRSRPRARAR